LRDASLELKAAESYDERFTGLSHRLIMVAAINRDQGSDP
jgi:hypothetical protein